MEQSLRAYFRPTAETLTYAHDRIEAAEPGAGPQSLSPILRDITKASQLELAGERAGIMNDIARRIAAARASADPKLLTGIIRQLNEERQSRLAIAKRNAIRDRHEKREAVLQSRPSPPPRRKRGGRRAPKADQAK